MNTNDPAARPPGAAPPASPGHPVPPPPSTSPSTPSNPSLPISSPFTIPNPTDNTAEDKARWNKLFYNTSIGVVIAAPIVALLPPRRFDLSTFGLGICWCMSAGFAVEQKTGKGLLWHIGSRIPSEGNRRRKLEEARMNGEGMKWQGDRPGEQRKDSEKGFLKRIWMGKEGDDWVEERMKKEKEALEDGRGYGGLIVEQVREVFGIKEEDDEEDDDEKEGKKEE